MHYNITGYASSFGKQALHAPSQDPAGRASPARMQQGDTPTRHHQVDRNTVGYGDREENAGCARDPTIDALDLDPSAAGIESHELDPVHLVAQSDG
jgi:hypothetical protein